VYLFVVYCFEVQIVEMALESAASSSDSVGVRRSQKVNNRWCTVMGFDTVRSLIKLNATVTARLPAGTTVIQES
jgi:hypothetical protein